MSLWILRCQFVNASYWSVSVNWVWLYCTMCVQSAGWYRRSERSQGALRCVPHPNTSTSCCRRLGVFVDQCIWPTRPRVTAQAVVPWTERTDCTIPVLWTMYSVVYERRRGVCYSSSTAGDQQTIAHLPHSFPTGQYDIHPVSTFFFIFVALFSTVNVGISHRTLCKHKYGCTMDQVL